MFFLSILTNYVLPIIYDSFIVLVLVLLFLFIFRIKDSNIRILFFFLPLIKPFIVILEKIDFQELYKFSPSGASGLRLPDPTNIIGIEITPEELTSDPNYLGVLVILTAILVVLLARWVGIAVFYRRLAYEDKVGRREVPDLYEIIDSYVNKIKTKSPDVSLTHRNYTSPFIIGVRRFTLVLSPKLLDELNNDEKNILIQHELSHIKRKDNLIGWIALILRDLYFFNPFAHIAYYLIRNEQEKACDKLVVKYSEKDPIEISKNILSSLLKLKSVLKPRGRSVPLEGSTFSPVVFFNHRRLENRVSTIIKTNPNKIFMRFFPRILMYMLFIILLYIQIMYIVKINDFSIFLR
jgi:beta-lactamase regulating signal transducer with metallopeptidase domain